MLSPPEGRLVGWALLAGNPHIIQEMFKEESAYLGRLRETARDKDAWRAAVYGVIKSQIQLGDLTTAAAIY